MCLGSVGTGWTPSSKFVVVHGLSNSRGTVLVIIIVLVHNNRVLIIGRRGGLHLDPLFLIQKCNIKVMMYSAV